MQDSRVPNIKMKFVLVVLCAIILVASSQMISLEDLLRAYDVSSDIQTNEIAKGKFFSREFCFVLCVC